MQQEVIMPHQTKPGRSLLQAYYHFLRDPNESRLLKMMPLALMGIVPFTILEDIFLPFLGIIEVLPTTLVVVVVAFLTYRRVQTHR